MVRTMTTLSVLLATSMAIGADQPAKFAGEWKTTAGPVTFQQAGDEVTGKIVFFNLPLKGKVEGKGLAVSYVENQIKVDAALEFDPSGNAFTGTSKASNGNQWPWNGWRADPSALSAKPADFAGLWLTSLGLMELNADGAKVKGRYALRGTSSLEGDAKGRHLDFKLKTFRFTGPGFFDLDEKGHHPQPERAGPTAWPPGMAGRGARPPSMSSTSPLVAGQMVDGSTKPTCSPTPSGPPKGTRPSEARKWPVALILHGSNMNARAYVNTLAVTWPDIARDYILLGINGETPSNISADSPAFNYTYINYVGRSTFGGYPRDRPREPRPGPRGDGRPQGGLSDQALLRRWPLAGGIPHL